MSEPTITVEEDVEVPKDAIDLEELYDKHNGDLDAVVEEIVERPQSGGE